MREIKGYRLTGEVAENHLRGAAAVMGNMDRGHDVIYPGAFKRALPEFLKSGFVADTHDWSMGDVVAMPVAAKEVGTALVVDAEFHSDDRSQAVRTRCVERLERGLTVGLSVGFNIADGGYIEFANGQELLKHAEVSGQDMNLFDAKGIRKRPGYCRAITGIDELYEFSVVPVPMNPAATASGVKGANAPLPVSALPTTVREFEAYLRDAGWSKADATAIASHGFGVLLRDAGGSEVDNVTTDDGGMLEATRLALAQFRLSLLQGVRP